MTHQDLTDLLERAADRTDVGPPPLDGMLRVVRRRRRRHAILGGAGLTLLALTAAIVIPVMTNPPSDRTPAVPLPGATDTPESPAISPTGPTIDLEGSYIVTALVRRNGNPAPVALHGVRLGVTFRAHEIRASDGCNELSGGYAIRGDRFRLKRDASATLRGCIPGPPPLFTRLSDVTSVTRDQGGTYLDDADGDVVIALARR
jgi:heat shock protein HslJ